MENKNDISEQRDYPEIRFSFYSENETKEEQMQRLIKKRNELFKKAGLSIPDDNLSCKEDEKKDNDYLRRSR